jgi:hypothetical protein
MLAAITHVDDPEKITPARRLVYADEELTEEQIFVWSSPEERLEHVAPKEPSPRMGGNMPGPQIRVHTNQLRRSQAEAPGPLRWRVARPFLNFAP